LTPPFEVNPFT